MKSRTILSDADGVLLEWNKPFNEFMAAKGFPQQPNTDWFYSIPSRHDCDPATAHRLIAEFNEGDYMRNLKPFADSVEYVRILKELDFKFIIITSLSDSEAAYNNRKYNLDRVFGDAIEELICLKTGIDKYHALQRWEGSGHFWIEDHMRNAEAGHELGLKPILVSHPYNAHYKTDLFPTVNNITPWKQIFDIICKEYEITYSP